MHTLQPTRPLIRGLRLVVLTALTATGLIAATPADSEAGNFKYHVVNRSTASVWVVMDTDRESHLLRPNVPEIFSEANIGDNPTFRVYTVKPGDARGDLVFTDTFHTVRLFKDPTSRHLKWDGAKMDDD